MTDVTVACGAALVGYCLRLWAYREARIEDALATRLTARVEAAEALARDIDQRAQLATAEVKRAESNIIEHENKIMALQMRMSGRV